MSVEKASKVGVLSFVECERGAIYSFSAGIAARRAMRGRTFTGAPVRRSTTQVVLEAFLRCVGRGKIFGVQ